MTRGLQFTTMGFTERKILLVCDVIRLFRQHHDTQVPRTCCSPRRPLMVRALPGCKTSTKDSSSCILAIHETPSQSTACMLTSDASFSGPADITSSCHLTRRCRSWILFIPGPLLNTVCYYRLSTTRTTPITRMLAHHRLWQGWQG